MRRLVRWMLVLAVAVIAVALAAAPSVHRELLARLTTALSEALGARVRLDGTTGIVTSLLGGSIRVHGLRAAKPGAFRVVVEDVVIDFAPRALLDRRIAISRLVLRRPRIAVTDRVADALPSGGASETNVTVAIDRVVVDDGRVVVAVAEDAGRRLYGADRVDVTVRPIVGEDRWHAIVDRLGLRPRGARVPPLTARGVLKGRARGVAARLDAVIERAGRVAAAADVRIDRNPLTYRVAVATDGMALGPFMTSPPASAIRGTAVVRGDTGAERRLAYTASIVVQGSRVGDVGLGFDGHGAGARHRLEATATVAGARVVGDGTLDVDAARVEARVRATGDLTGVGRRLGLPLGGAATVVAEITGPLATPRIAGTADVVDPRWGDTRLRRLSGQLAVEARADGVRLDVARLAADLKAGTSIALVGPTTLTVGRTVVLAPTTLAAREGRATVSAQLGPGRAVQVDVDVPSLDLAALCRTLDAGECSGVVRANARLAGEGPSPTVHAVVHHSIGADVVADGRVPFPWPAGTNVDRVPLALDVRSTGFDAAALQPFAGGAVTKLGGRLDAAIRVAGPFGSPSIDGSLGLRDGQLEATATRVTYRDVNLSARLVPGAIVIDALSARADGSVTGSGRVALDRFTPGALDVSLVLDGLRVVNLPQYDAKASGTLAVAGTAGAPRVEGGVTIGPAVARPVGLSSGASSTAPDPTIEVVGRAAPVPVVESGPSLADALALDLAVQLGDDVMVRRSDARIDLGGRLQVTKASGGPLQVNGVVRLVRGWATFQSRRFTLEPSAIRFDGAPTAPTLDLTATSRAGSYEVEVHVSGRPDKPVLGLTSEPPLSESDVLAVLLFGAPTQDLGQSQQADLQQRAVGLASTYVAGGLTSSVRDALGLDVLDVSAGEGVQPGEVRLGRYVTNDIFLSIAQEFGSRVGQAAALEYRVRPRVSVRLSTSTSGSSGIDILWHRRY